jgi:hypothetical protein
VQLVNAQETDQPDRNQVEGDDVVEKLGHHENQDAGKQGDEGRKREMDIQETSLVFDTVLMHEASSGRMVANNPEEPRCGNPNARDIGLPSPARIGTPGNDNECANDG